MTTFTHVLFPTDLSEDSLLALRVAARVARAHSAKLTVLHVVPSFDPVKVPPDRIGTPSPVVTPPSRDDILREVSHAVRGVPLDGVEVTFVALAGDPAEVIVEHTHSSAADLIVMRTHGRRGIPRLLIGSIAETVIRATPCLVLTVPPGVPPAAAAADGTFTRVLCAVDLSAASQHLMGVAVEWAQRSDGAVTVVHVCQIEDEPRLHAHTAEVRERVLQDARNKLHAFVAAAPKLPGGLEEIVALGDVDDEILRVAKDCNSALVVIGEQARGGVSLALLGSTAQHVVRAATCPVLVVRSPDASA